MSEITLIATTSFGLEAVVRREVQRLGFDDVQVSEGKVEFKATSENIPKANLWLRSADRVLLKMGEFPALTFDELFEQTKALPWENWITKEGEFRVTGKAVKSTLGSVRACQSIVKKAVVERLKIAYKTSWFAETGPEFTIQIAMLKDVATLTIDTSGSGLNKRGYRVQTGTAALRETLAAALVQLSFWDRNRLLIDPMCGSGTILIEAAMIGRNIAPGLKRPFAAQEWPTLGQDMWREERAAAREVILQDHDFEIFGYDIDEQVIDAGKANAKRAGVAKNIHFEQKDIQDIWIDRQYGVVISNPPYGKKTGEFKEMNQIYIALNNMFRKKKGWSIYILTADKILPKYFKRSWPDRVRKLYNGVIEVQYYQYFGERPPG